MAELYNYCNIFTSANPVRAYFLLPAFLILAAFLPGGADAQTSITDGNWHTPATWQDNVIPVAGNDVIVSKIVTVASGFTAEANNLTIKSTGKLIVEGTLVVNGNLVMEFAGNDDSELELMTGSVTIVKGNVHLTNKVSLNLSSYLIIMGNLTKDGAAQQGDIVIDDASIYVFGSVDSTTTGIYPCDAYDNLTVNNNENCHAGTIEAFEDNAGDNEIPIDVIEIVTDCEPPILVNPGDQLSCGSYALPVISGTNLSGNEAYYSGSGGTGTKYLPGDLISASATFYIYDKNMVCTDEEIFRVDIYPYPQTGNIVAD